MKGINKTVAVLFFLLSGISLGTALGKRCTGISVLSWLAYNMTVGLGAADPVVLDLLVFKLSFGFELSVNAAQVICVIISLIIYNRCCKSI